ncbi:saccharopine dehydrogenase NADP-binding domain-containing protein [Nocardia higoensis]|uniref:saccharopine dehydrogenase NADP-binding domain-containing protein n=1 Tax=Nocardia higoensis TaxID=228599 RepID=UPI0002E14A6E|nr:saccharopine dehydrogenase NADP-binding domain-containing protein [Nocardia higoensis]
MTTQTSSPVIAVYGATGHTGGYQLAELRRRGLTPVLVGRDAQRLRAAAAAAELPDAEIRVAELTDHTALVAAFSGVDAVISSLSAYVRNGEPVLAAAIEVGAHYTDLSGEQLFVKKVFDDYAAAAETAGVTVISGVTDNNVAGDLLAHLAARRVSGPAEIVISHLSRSRGNGSKGSARTVLAGLDWFRSGGWHFADGELRTGPTARHPEITFPGDTAPTAVAKFPQPPVLTVPRHTEVASVEGVLAADILDALGSFTPELVEQLPDQPSTDLRYAVVVDAHSADGRVARGIAEGVDSYRDSALLAVEVATRLAAGTTKPGALAPAEAFEPTEFLDSIARFGITWRIEQS